MRGDGNCLETMYVYDYPWNLVKHIVERRFVWAPFPRKWISPKSSHIRLGRIYLQSRCECAVQHEDNNTGMSWTNTFQRRGRVILVHHWSIYCMLFGILFQRKRPNSYLIKRLQLNLQTIPLLDNSKLYVTVRGEVWKKDNTCSGQDRWMNIVWLGKCKILFK